MNLFPLQPNFSCDNTICFTTSRIRFSQPITSLRKKVILKINSRIFYQCHKSVTKVQFSVKKFYLVPNKIQFSAREIPFRAKKVQYTAKKNQFSAKENSI